MDFQQSTERKNDVWWSLQVCIFFIFFPIRGAVPSPPWTPLGQGEPPRTPRRMTRVPGTPHIPQHTDKSPIIVHFTLRFLFMVERNYHENILVTFNIFSYSQLHTLIMVLRASIRVFYVFSNLKKYLPS